MISENMPILVVLFFLVATFYSMVGFGGGSSYIALLILFNISYLVSPSVALICNIVVVTGGLFHFMRNRQLSLKSLFPFIVTSIPFAYLGGIIPVNKVYFQFILGVLLFLSGLRMIFFTRDQYISLEQRDVSSSLSFFLGAIIGFLSGLVGIGGGIFLAPILYVLRWGTPRKIAATSSAFIFVNSVSGLFGQVQKSQNMEETLSYWPLFLAVLLGGQIGSILCNTKISQRRVEVLTSFLVLVVSFRLIYNSTQMI